VSDRAISDIRVGKRHRVDLGDVAGLGASILEVGLLHPVVVRPDGLLIAGERRLEACKAIGMARIPVTVVDLADVVLGELAENSARKDFLPSEMVAIKRAIEPIIATPHGGSRATPLPQLPLTESKVETFHLASGKTRDKAAAYAGVSGRTLEKAEAIVKAAEAEPERFSKLLDDMDRTRRVDGPYKRLKVMRQAEAIRAEKPSLPGRGPYRVIAADPPWPYEIRKEDPSYRATHPYPQMSIADICAMPVGDLAHDDCILWLWTTNHHIREAFGVLDAWGFQHKTILTWVKDRMGTGDWLRGQTEHAMMAVRGKPTVELTNQTTVIHGPMRANSQKPEEFYRFVEKLCPAPLYAELFSRHSRPRWDGHGDEHVVAEGGQ
jgi:N6-adenosine-specific RNA methylase IME4